MGDINCTLGGSSGSTGRSGIMETLLNDLSMVSMMTIAERKGLSYTFDSGVKGHRSLIDHILVERTIACLISESRVHDDHALNHSDHFPVAVTLNLDVSLPQTLPLEKWALHWKKVASQCD